MYGVYINCSRYPFIEQILALVKPYETRTRNMLKDLCGMYVYLVETGKRSVPMVKGIAKIESFSSVPFEDVGMREAAKILGTDFDIKPSKQKVFYKLTDVKAVEPFPVPESRINHGRSYTEF